MCCQILPQTGLVAAVLQQTAGEVLVVRVGKSICQIVCELSQYIILPDSPSRAVPEFFDLAVYKNLRVGEIVAAKGSGVQRAL